MYSIWAPKLVFYNTLHEEKTEVDSDSNVFVNKEGGFVFAERMVIDETKIFKGSENNLIYERSYMKTFICEFNMEMYPFDTQKCNIDLRVKPKDQNFIELVVGKIELLRTEELMQYMIIHYEIKSILCNSVNILG